MRSLSVFIHPMYTLKYFREVMKYSATALLRICREESIIYYPLR